MKDSIQNEIFSTGIDPDSIDPSLKFSPSGLNVWDECPKKGYYTYHRGFRKEAQESYLRLGTIIHRMLALHYMEIPSMEFVGLEEEFPTYQEQQLMMESLGLIYRYETFYGPREKDWNVLAVEQYMIVPYETPKGRTVYLNGFIDLILETHQGLMVVDHKSGGKFWTADEVYFDRQLMIYAYMLHSIGHTPSTILINNINTTPSVVRNVAKQPVEKLFSRVPVPIKPQRIEGYMAKVGQNIDRILDTTSFSYSTSKNCSKCYFKEACSMEFDGINPESYLQLNFSKQGTKPFSLIIKPKEIQ